MRVLYFDCFSGISGDMTVGALRDLGVEEAVFTDALTALGIDEEFHAHFRRDARQNIARWKFDVHTHHGHAHKHEHTHEHEHGHTHEHVDEQGHSHQHHDAEHAHGRSFKAIRSLIEGSKLSDAVKS